MALSPRPAVRAMIGLEVSVQRSGIPLALSFVALVLPAWAGDEPAASLPLTAPTCACDELTAQPLDAARCGEPDAVALGASLCEAGPRVVVALTASSDWAWYQWSFDSLARWAPRSEAVAVVNEWADALELANARAAEDCLRGEDPGRTYCAAHRGASDLLHRLGEPPRARLACPPLPCRVRLAGGEAPAAVIARLPRTCGGDGREPPRSFPMPVLHVSSLTVERAAEPFSAPGGTALLLGPLLGVLGGLLVSARALARELPSLLAR